MFFKTLLHQNWQRRLRHVFSKPVRKLIMKVTTCFSRLFFLPSAWSLWEEGCRRRWLFFSLLAKMDLEVLAKKPFQIIVTFRLPCLLLENTLNKIRQFLIQCPKKFRLLICLFERVLAPLPSCIIKDNLGRPQIALRL